MAQQLFRQDLIDRMIKEDKTSRAMQITNTSSWLVLIGITIIIVATVLWAFIGRIPITVSGNGIIASPTSTNAIFIDETGTIVSVVARKGAEVHMGDVVLTYKTSDNQVKKLLSSQEGVISDVLVKVDDLVKQGSETLRISPRISGSQVAVSYINLAQSKKITRGMNVQVYLDSVNRQTHGHMWARVVNIDTHASSTMGLYYVLGEGNNLASTFQRDNAVLAVTCELYPDENTVSGYQWTNDEGKTTSVTNGSPITVKIIVDEVRPIEKMFSKLKEIWGD